MSLRGMDIFERHIDKDPSGFLFVMPGAAIRGDDVTVEYHRDGSGLVTATHSEVVNGHTIVWTGTADSHVGAVIALVADRLGHEAAVRMRPESNGSQEAT